MDLTWFLSVTAFAAAMSATPGPNNAMLASSGATFGFRRTAPHMLGVSVGFPLMLIAVALGAGELLRTYPVIHVALKWIGAAYLLWLAYRIASSDPGRKAAGERQATPLGFFQAALFQWVNPKAWIVVLGAIATFTTAGRIGIVAQAVALAAVFLVITLVVTACWTMTGVGAARMIRTDRGLRIFNVTMAGLLLLSLVPVAMGG